MLSVKQAQDRILQAVNPTESEGVALQRAVGRVLSQDIISNIDLPVFDNSSVDGFAVRAEDLGEASPASPRRLEVIADIPAGIDPDITIEAGQAARIMTGAPVPSGANAVVMVEDTDFNDRSTGTPAPAEVGILKTCERGENIRRRGGDVVAGERVLSAGKYLKPQDIGMLATLGFSFPAVYRKPRIALLSSGDELVPVDATPAPGQIRESNSTMLAAQAEQLGVEVLSLGIASDDPESVRLLLDMALEQKADLIISSAGVSVGAFDYVREVVELNGSLTFWQVNMRPGKPLAFGDYRGIPFAGLPGNPVSAFIGFEVFLRPALQKLSGLPPQERRLVRAVLDEQVYSDGRESYLRAIAREQAGVLQVRLTGHQGSGNLLSLVRANALLIIPSGVKSLPRNTEVDIWLI